jgi:hypothetical protein
MAKVSTLQSNFGGGEYSPLVHGRVDSDRYPLGLKKCQNFVPMIQGGLVRRSGTRFVAPAKYHDKASRLYRFEFSVTQAYVLEFGDQYIRFFKDNSQITLTAQNITGITNANPAVVTINAHGYSNGDHVDIYSVGGTTELNNRRFKVANVAANTFELQDLHGNNINSTSYGVYTSGGTAAKVYEVTVPYGYTDIGKLKFTQSADVLYIVHPNFRPAKLTRTGHTSWTWAYMDFTDGPYLNADTSGITLTPSAVTGTGITITASGALFASTDVGRHIRIKEGSVWGWVKITGYTSSTVVTVDVQPLSTLTNLSAKSTWRLGVWSSTTGFPSCVTFHETRLFFGGVANYPQRVDGSVIDDYQNFAPSDNSGTVASTNAVTANLNSNDVNAVKWIVSDEKGLLVGANSGEWVVKPSSSGAISPTNITASRATRYGTADVQPIVVGKAALYIQRAQRKLREMIYFYDVDGFRSADVSLLSEHITSPGITELSFQSEPQPIVWVVRSDGYLLGMTYERDPETLKVGWHKHVIGGQSDSAGTQSKVISTAVIPSSDAKRDELWVLVYREINGQKMYYVEYVEKVFDQDTDQEDSFFVDSGLSYDNPVYISSITKGATPTVTTSSNHGWSNGDKVRFAKMAGMTELEGASATITVTGATTFTININTTNYGTYVVVDSGSEVRKEITTISGLWHLEGQTVSILADGASHPNKTVANGSITLTARHTVVQVGLGYNSDAQMLRPYQGAQDGATLGKTMRMHKIAFYLYRSLGLKYGKDFSNLNEIYFRNSSDLLSRAVALTTGILSEPIDMDYDRDNEVCIRQDQPLPTVILAVAPQIVVQDGG